MDDSNKDEEQTKSDSNKEEEQTKSDSFQFPSFDDPTQ